MAQTSATISVRDLHRAAMTTEDIPGTKPVYDAPVRMKTETVNIAITPTRVSAQAYGDGGLAEAYEGTTGGTVSAQVHAMSTADAAALFGCTIDADGGLVYSDNDVAPYVAMGFVTDQGNGTAAYVWLYKVKWQVPDFSVDTKTNTVTFQQPTITGTYLSRTDGTFVVDGKSKTPYKFEYREDSPSFDPAIAEAWFEAVKDPTSPTVDPEP